MKTTRSRACLLVALFIGLAWSGSILAAAPDSPRDLLQAFIDKHELAGVVALVADKDKALSVEAVGFADVAAG